MGMWLYNFPYLAHNKLKINTKCCPYVKLNILTDY